MKSSKLVYLLGLSVCFVLSGCVVRTYEATKDRVDQDLSAGNRGYLAGSMPASAETLERKTTRQTRVIEIELHPPIKFENAPKQAAIEPQAPSLVTEDREMSGNRGYITRSVSPAIVESAAAGSFQKYTVQKNDTLQKISQKFFGTTRKWTKIYDANKDTMKGPNKIYPGQVINIPSLESRKQGLKEPKENLK